MSLIPILSLQKKRIVVTRAQPQAGELAGLLRDRGAEAFLIPLVECHSLLKPLNVHATLASLSSFDWILFTSSNAIQFFFDLLGELKIPTSTRIACVGRKSAATLGTFGYRPSFVPDHSSGKSLALGLDVTSGQSVLFPSAVQASKELIVLLESRGVTVKQWPIYTTLSKEIEPQAQRWLNSGFDAITFSSPSAVDSFCEQVSNPQQMLSSPFVACIGPTTRQQAIDRGLSVDGIPDRPDSVGLVNILDRHFASGAFHG